MFINIIVSLFSGFTGAVIAFLVYVFCSDNKEE